MSLRIKLGSADGPRGPIVGVPMALRSPPVGSSLPSDAGPAMDVPIRGSESTDGLRGQIKGLSSHIF